ncbi:DUF488 family protein [Arthrobacter castelli]|uniref:DUF488 domain-containing protein n=1 Tax=Arthrobacter castelli TaxID=271431 RepID=UPI00047B8208|nr:DUF488 domain-containing protein [Arthrobacter castelli]
MAQHRLYTVGHGSAEGQQFVERLKWAGVEQLVDVRIGPGSRKHPHFGKDSLQQWLPEAGVGYRWDKRLGGFRKLEPDSPDVALRNESFKAYAGHMRTEQFLHGLDELLEQAMGAPTGIMCSETVWWRCHRRLIADHCVLVNGFEVRHLMPQGRSTGHQPTAGVRTADGGLVYDDVESARQGTRN